MSRAMDRFRMTGTVKMRFLKSAGKRSICVI